MVTTLTRLQDTYQGKHSFYLNGMSIMRAAHVTMLVLNRFILRLYFAQQGMHHCAMKTPSSQFLVSSLTYQRCYVDMIFVPDCYSHLIDLVQFIMLHLRYSGTCSVWAYGLTRHRIPPLTRELPVWPAYIADSTIHKLRVMISQV